MASAAIGIDPQRGPARLSVRILTPLFAEVTIYYRRPGDAKWTRAAHFDVSELDDGTVSTTVPALVPGSELLARSLVWGGNEPFIVGVSVRQQGDHCAGSPLDEVRGETGEDKGEVCEVRMVVA